MSRPAAKELDPKNQALTLQQMDTDYYTAAPRPDMPAFAQTLGKKYEIYGGQVPALRLVSCRVVSCLYGITLLVKHVSSK